MEPRNIIVIGASAGGFEALKKLVAGLPENFPAAVFIVWHISAEVTGVLPQVLNKSGKLPVAHAIDGEKIEMGKIYVAPPDRHLLIEHGKVRVTRGPKENRFRPAVDPLFRSAAYAYRERVIGVILSGALDDGTSGLWTIKHFGGTAIVQDPRDAEISSMPENALREVVVDHCLPVSQIAELLVSLVTVMVETSEVVMEENNLTEIEIGIAREDNALESGIMNLGELTPFTCPDCHGVLSSYKDGERSRFRCHTGHAFSADTLLATVTEKIEDSLWNAIRGIEESIMLLNQMGNHFANNNQVNLSALYFKKAFEAEARAQMVRQAAMNNERMSKDSLLEESAGDGNGNGHKSAAE